MSPRLWTTTHDEIDVKHESGLHFYRPRSRGDSTFVSVRVCACVCVRLLWALSCLNRLTFDLVFGMRVDLNID